MMQQHPLSAAFPAMSETDYQALVDSIESIGVQNPITIYEGMVIDGWHRYKAASELGMECPSVELDSDIDPRDFVLAQNKARRHITAAQLAMATTEVYQWRPRGNPEISKTAPGAELEKEEATAEEMAEAAGVSKRTIEQAKAVKTKAVDEIQNAVKSGEIGLRKAAEIAKLPKEQQAEAIHKPMPKKEEEPEPEEVDIDQSEIDSMQADLKLFYKLQAEDDLLKAAVEENKRLTEENKSLRLRINGLMAEKDAAIKQAKSYQRQVKKLEKAHG